MRYVASGSWKVATRVLVVADDDEMTLRRCGTFSIFIITVVENIL